jgi:hypothetical protein
VWKKRYAGNGYNPCYSFAIKGFERTIRFWNWTETVDVNDCLASSIRHWDTNFAPYPSLPVEQTPFDAMLVWEHVYKPQFEAREAGAVKMRRLAYSNDCYLFEHVRNNWVPLMRSEALEWWKIARDQKSMEALAAFEWTWYWTNPFGRSGALSGDALSLIIQKLHGFKMRSEFYHQDQEALLLSFEEYVQKRKIDMTEGFTPKFKM